MMAADTLGAQARHSAIARIKHGNKLRPMSEGVSLHLVVFQFMTLAQNLTLQRQRQGSVTSTVVNADVAEW